MMDTIFIENLTVETIIGIYEGERNTKQPVLIDLEMQYDCTQASASDNITDALDYHKISKDIYSFVSKSSYHLIEALAEDIAQRILQNKRVELVTLKLSKPKALNQAKNVGIIITRENIIT